MNIRNIKSLEPQKHPQILYWFWDEVTLTNKQYMKDIERICNDTPFTLLFFTARGTLDFYGDRERLLPAFKEVAEYAHKRGVKIGLQLWRDFSQIQITDDNAVSLLVEKELTLDINGFAEYTAYKQGDRDGVCRSSSLYSAYVFNKTAEGEYDESSLEEITALCKTKSDDIESVRVTIDLGTEYAGKTAYVLTNHSYQSPDLFTDYYENSFSDILKSYSSVPFDGVGLDEFKSINVMHSVEIFKHARPFRERVYGKGFAKRYESIYTQTLKDCIFDMRYCPKGNPERTMRAINRYFDVLKDNVIKVENFVAEEAKRLYGQDIFIGLHNTYHNALSNDEIWQTGCMWWDLPREYGQTDEDICYPVRMGISCSHPQPILYDMFYEHKRAGIIYEKAVRDARYGVRIHYHAYHDTRDHRFDLENDEAIKNISRIESYVRMLNALDLPRPQMNLLVVFGRPAQANWYPHRHTRNEYDINGSLFVLEKCTELWNSGVVFPLVPSTKIDSRVLKVDENGNINYNGHTFKQMLFIAPEYSKKETLEFLLKASETNTVFIDGEATHDFDGDNCAEMFSKISEKAKVHPFDAKWLLANGVVQNAIQNGCVLEDGTVIVTDAKSAITDTKGKLKIELCGHTFSGLFSGMVAIHCNDNGEIDKLSYPGFTEIYRDNELYISSDSPCDLIINGDEITVISESEDNKIHFHNIMSRNLIVKSDSVKNYTVKSKCPQNSQAAKF